jgi:D-glycero-D-manno-heptose 1,7-bisphosphate phosphatase
MSGRPAVFFDRDGVLNAVVWRDGVAASPRAADELFIEADAPKAAADLAKAGYALFVVTNQPDIARGKMSAVTLADIHERLLAAVPDIAEIGVCPHDNAEGCSCRKPQPGLVTSLAERHGLDLARSWLIGDQGRDLACAAAAGCKSILLARPYNADGQSGADHLVETLSQAVDRILSLSQTQAPQ